MNQHILTQNKLLCAQVCSEGSEEEALDWLRRENPAGTSNNWQHSNEEGHAPAKCEKYPERTHYMFIC